MSTLQNLAQTKNRRPYTDDRPSDKSGLSLAQLFDEHAGYIYGIDRTRQDGSTLPPKAWEKEANRMLIETQELHFGGRPLTLEDYRSAGKELFDLGLDYAIQRWTEGRGWAYEPDKAVKRLFPSSSWINRRYLNEWRPGLILWLIIAQVKQPHLDGTRSLHWMDSENGPAELNEAVEHYLNANQSKPVPLEINAKDLRKARRIDDYFNAQDATIDTQEPQQQEQPVAKDDDRTFDKVASLIDDTILFASEAADQADRIKAAQALDELPAKVKKITDAAVARFKMRPDTAHGFKEQAGKMRDQAILEMQTA